MKLFLQGLESFLQDTTIYLEKASSLVDKINKDYDCLSKKYDYLSNQSFTYHYNSGFKDFFDTVNKTIEVFDWYTNNTFKDNYLEVQKILGGKNNKTWVKRKEELEAYLRSNDLSKSEALKIKSYLKTKKYLKTKRKDVLKDFDALLSKYI